MKSRFAPNAKCQVMERTSYRREIDRLKSKWPNAENDVNDSLAAKSLNADPGDAIPNLGEFSGRVFKRQILSTDLKDGQRGGFRLIYLVSPDRNAVELLSVYCKKERETVSVKEILNLIDAIQGRVQYSRIDVETVPDYAEVWLESEFIDYSPCTIRLLPGLYTVTCKIPPDRSALYCFSCDAGEQRIIRIEIP